MSESLRKAMLILEELRLSDRARSARELADVIELPKSTVQRMLQALEDAGLTTQEPVSRKYRLGPKTLTLGMAYRERLNLRNLALRHMRALRDQCAETVGLSIAVGAERMFIEEVQSQSELRTSSELGHPYPLWTGAPGRVLLAHLPERERATVLATAGDAAWAAVTPPSNAGLLDRLREIRERGHDRAFDETIAGVSALATPITDATGEVAAALSVSAPSARLDAATMDRMLPSVLRAARAISAELGA